MRSHDLPRIVFVTTAFLLGSCGSTSATPVDAQIEIEDFSFGNALTVPVGSTATVTNRDGVAHTWTSDEGAFDSDAIEPNASFSITLDEPGEFSFFCSIHPSMVGAITVTG